MNEEFWALMRTDNYLMAQMAVDMANGKSDVEFWTEKIEKWQSN